MAVFAAPAGSMSKLDYPDECRLENFLEWCLEKIQFCDLCDEIERLGYGIDHNIHVTKGSAIIELFRQRNNRTDDSNYLTDIESIVPVGVPVTDLPPTALSMVTFHIVFLPLLPCASIRLPAEFKSSSFTLC